MSRLSFFVTLLLLVPSSVGAQQTPTTELTDLRFGGHIRIDGVVATGRSIYSLGDGLLAAWDANIAEPLAWVETDARQLTLIDERPWTFTNREAVRHDIDTLAPVERIPHTGYATCVGSERVWAWNHDASSLTLLTDEALAFDNAPLPDLEARCSASPGQTWLAWYDGTLARAIAVSEDGQLSEFSVEWPYGNDPIVVPTPVPCVVGVTQDGHTECVALDGSGSTDADRSLAERSCTGFDELGAAVECDILDPVLTPRLLRPRPTPPIATRRIEDGVALIYPHAVMRFRATEEGTIMERTTFHGRTVLGVVGEATSLLVTCTDLGDEALFATEVLRSGEARESAVVWGRCPAAPFRDPVGVSARVGDSLVAVSASGIRVDATQSALSSSPAFGRSREALALTTDFSMDCGEDAFFVTRLERGSPVETVYGPLCVDDASLAPWTNLSGEAEGVAVLYVEGGAPHALPVGYDGRVRNSLELPVSLGEIERVVGDGWRWSVDSRARLRSYRLNEADAWVESPLEITRSRDGRVTYANGVLSWPFADGVLNVEGADDRWLVETSFGAWWTEDASSLILPADDLDGPRLAVREAWNSDALAELLGIEYRRGFLQTRRRVRVELEEE